MPTARRTRHAIPLLALGFRPFFLAAGAWALLAMLLWLAMVTGVLALPLSIAPADWHAHEMLFGYAAAAIAGFLLTAVPNWTGRLPVSGAPLAVLALLWLAGRIAMATGAWLGAWPAAVADALFLLALLALVLREVVSGRNWRNLPVAAALAGLGLANMWFHAATLGTSLATADALRLGIAVVALLIVLIGGRITPSFTRNWLAKRGPGPLPAAFATLDRLATAASLLALAAWVAAPDAAVTAAALAVAAVLLCLRLMRWQGQRTLAEPLVTVLHVGYLWLPLGLTLLAIAIVWPDAGTGAAVHGLTTGAIGTMTLAVMTRASLGHSGRPLRAGAGTSAIFVLINLAAAARVLAWAWPDAYLTLVHCAAFFWSAAFAGFVALYGPLMLRRRL